MLTAWEGEKSPVHRYKEGLRFANVVNDNDDDGGNAGDGDAQASSGRLSHGGATETRRCYYCKNEGHLKPDCLKLKAKRSAEEAENTAAGGVTKAADTKDGAGEHAHMMLVNKFQEFNTGAEDHFFFLQVSEEKFSNLPHRWLILGIESTIDIITNKSMVSNIRKLPSPIILHCNAGSRQVEYTADLNI